MRLYRFICLALAAGLVIFTAAGCVSSPAESGSSVEETAEEEKVSTPATEETSRAETEVPETSEASSEEPEPQEETSMTEVSEDQESSQEEESSEVSQEEESSQASLPEGQLEAFPAKEPEDEDFVRVKDYIPDIEVLLMYATDGNFTGEVIYTFTDAYLRYGTVKKLSEAQEALKELGYRILIWDAFRPVSAQFVLWDVCPDSRYVANPLTGYSSHSRGNTIDLTIVTLAGDEVEMPTGFDDFSYYADRDYSDCTELAASNATMLEDIMMEAGFEPYSGEWWHFSDYDYYPVEEEFEPPASPQ